MDIEPTTMFNILLLVLLCTIVLIALIYKRLLIIQTTILEHQKMNMECSLIFEKQVRDFMLDFYKKGL